MDVITVVEAKKYFSDLMAQVAYNGQRVIIERHGKPMMAWVSVEDLQRLEALERGQDTYARGLAALALADAARTQIAAERKGEPLPDSTQILYGLREGRGDE